MALGWGGGGTQKGRQSAEEHESSDREIPMESLQMDRLGQIIVICFLRTTDAGGWRGETRIKEEEKKKERNTSFQPPKLQRTDCSKGKKINLLKIPPHPLFLTLHLSIPPIRTHTHTHTICFYQHTLARALKPAELRKFRSGRRVGREVTAECPIVDEEGLTWTPETVHVCECARVFVCNLWLNLTYYFKNPLPLSPLSTALCVTPLHPPLLRLSHHPHTSALADGYIHAQFHRRAQSCFYL